MKYGSWIEKLGFSQKRCAHCLEPFFPLTKADALTLASLRLCPDCQKLFFAYNGSRCHFCGNPVESDKSKDKIRPVCPKCEISRPIWHGVAYFGLYEGALRELILRLKFGRELHIAHILADFLFSAASCLPRPDILAPVPQFPGRLYNRGFNQAWEIARKFGALSGFNLNPMLLERKFESPPQEGLNAREREENVQGAFGVRHPVASSIVWIIDDVMTSGATLAEIAKILINAGAKGVYALFVARTPLN